MKFENLIEGMRILKAQGAKGFCCAAEHDILYLCGTADVQLSEAQHKQLENLGFHVDEDVESWAAFI